MPLEKPRNQPSLLLLVVPVLPATGRPIWAARPVPVLTAVCNRSVMPAATQGATSTRLRSEEHTSELQSLMRISYAVFCLKKKKTNTNSTHPEYVHQHILNPQHPTPHLHTNRRRT